MSLSGYRLPCMSIAYRYPLAVSFQIPSIQSVRQDVELIASPLGYDYFLYSGTSTLFEIDTTACVQELLALVPTYPISENLRHDPLSPSKYWNETYDRDDLDHEKVLAFVRKWGRVGQLSPARNGIYELDQDYYATALGVFGEKRKHFDPDELIVRDLKLMSEGTIVPYIWVQDSLRQLAKMTRLTLGLERNSKNGELSVDLNRKNMKRLLAAWNCLTVAFEDSEDVTASKYNLHKVWNQKPKGRKVVLDDNYCAGIYRDYIRSINYFLSPITQNVLTTNDFKTINELKGTFETALSFILYKFWTDEMRVSHRCHYCNRLFIPVRNREDRKYCSGRCRETVNKKNYRDRIRAAAKVSNKHASTKPKGR